MTNENESVEKIINKICEKHPLDLDHEMDASENYPKREDLFIAAIRTERKKVAELEEKLDELNRFCEDVSRGRQDTSFEQILFYKKCSFERLQEVKNLESVLTAERARAEKAEALCQLSLMIRKSAEKDLAEAVKLLCWANDYLNENLDYVHARHREIINFLTRLGGKK